MYEKKKDTKEDGALVSESLGICQYFGTAVREMGVRISVRNASGVTEVGRQSGPPVAPLIYTAVFFLRPSILETDPPSS